MNWAVVPEELMVKYFKKCILCDHEQVAKPLWSFVSSSLKWKKIVFQPGTILMWFK